jgi:hypothetical protein
MNLPHAGRAPLGVGSDPGFGFTAETAKLSDLVVVQIAASSEEPTKTPTAARRGESRRVPRQSR